MSNGNGGKGKVNMSQPNTSTPKMPSKVLSNASPNQSQISQSEKPNMESRSQSQIKNVMSSTLPPSSSNVKSAIPIRPDKPDKHDSKRRREDTLSSRGSSLGASLGDSIMIDRDEITVKHDELKHMIDTAVANALKAAMSVASLSLEAALKNIFTERIDLLESRVFDVEQAIDDNAKSMNDSLRDHKVESSKSISECQQRIYNNERSIFENELYISDMEIKVNELEQYTRRNSIRIHGMEEWRWRGRENTIELVSDFLYNQFGLETDIEIAHRVGEKGRNRNEPRSIIVKFVRRSDKMEVMLRRKQLKGSGISISDDLTVKNVKLIKVTRENERIEAAWSWDGKVYAKGVNGHKFLLYPGFDVDAELDKMNKGD